MALLVHAQGRKPGRRKPVFDVPEKGSEPETPTRADAADAIARTVKRLAGWPHERARRAAERLIVQKERSKAAILGVLISSDKSVASLKPGAAYVLGRIGEPGEFMTLLHVCVEKKQQRHAAVFLEAAWRLNDAEAVAEAFRFFYLSETTLRHEAVKFVLDRVGKKNLDEVRKLLDPRRAERPYTREIGLRLLDRLVESRGISWDEIADRFYRALGDRSPQVAARAMRILASRNDEKNVARLNEAITGKSSYWRTRSYATIALSLLSSTFKEQPYSQESIELLRGSRGLLHRESLARASSALGLSQVALRTSDPELSRLLDKEIPIVLIDAVGAGSRHYRDFGTVMPLAYNMLRRITGQTLPSHAPRWAQWWRDNGATFRARRELVEVRADDVPATQIEWTPPLNMGPPRMRVSVLAAARPEFRHGEALAIPTDEMARLVDALRKLNFFERPEARASRADKDSDHAVVLVRVGDLDRAAAFGGGDKALADQKAVAALFADVTAKYGWQRWWDVKGNPNWQTFVARHRKWFASHDDKIEREKRLRSMIAACLDDLIDPKVRHEAVELVRALSVGASELPDAERDAFISAVRAEPAANGFVVATVDLLVPQAGLKAAHGLIDALAQKIGTGAEQALLQRICGSLPGPEIRKLLSDPRWKVRRAAVGAQAERDTGAGRGVLRAALKDEEIRVRTAAAVALARRHDASVLPVLTKLASRRNPKDVREKAAYAHGLLGGREGLAAVRAALEHDADLSVRYGAIRGVAEGGDPGAADLLFWVFRKVADRDVRNAAALALVDLESPVLVQRIIERIKLTQANDPERVALVSVLGRMKSEDPLDMLRRILQGDDAFSKDAAAFGLARRWDDIAMEQLIAMVRAGRKSKLAVRHLQMLTSRAFASDQFSRQADNYSGFWASKSTENPKLWFVASLEARGYDTVALSAWAADKKVQPATTDAMVPVLLRVLRAEEWYLRRNASYLLSRHMGPDNPGVVSYATSSTEEERIVKAYNAWWRDKLKKAERERRG